jgi:hypothetical protein
MFKKLLKTSILFGFIGVCTLSHAQFNVNRGSSDLIRQVHRVQQFEKAEIPSKNDLNLQIGNAKALCGLDFVEYALGKNLNVDDYLSGIMTNVANFKAVTQEYYAPTEVWVYGAAFINNSFGEDVELAVVLYDENFDFVTYADVDASTTFGYSVAQFDQPYALTGSYTVAVFNLTATNVAIYSNFTDATTKSGRGEDLSGFIYNDDYWYSALEWLEDSDETEFDADFTIEPIVDYDFFSDFSIDATPSCVGTDIELTNNSTAIVESRFYNTKAFDNYFFGTADDTYTWTLADGTTVNTKDATTTHTTDGSYDITLDISLNPWTGTTACEDTKTETVEFLALPTVEANVDNAAICLGDEVIFTGSGADSYTWDNGVTDGAAFEPTATGTLTYEVTGEDANGCTNTATVDVTVNALPTVEANVDNAAICLGEEVIFTGSGADSYTWNNGVDDGIAFEPTAAGTLTYEVTGEDANGCANTATVDVTVNALPTVEANVDNTEICLGEEVIFTGSGADSYTWDNGVTDGAAFEPTAVGNLTYEVTGEDANGCTNTATVDVTVNAPIVEANVDNTEICLGEEVTFTASGNAVSYSWDNGVTDGAAFEPTATGTLTYEVTGEDANGCTNTATVDVTVNALPTVTAGADQSVCEGTQVTLSGSGADTYTWDNGVDDGVAFTPASAGTVTYEVTGEDANGCENTAIVDVTVNALPTVTLDSFTSLCDNGGLFTLTGGLPAGGVYSGSGVSNGEFDPSIGADTYVITYTYEDGNGCSNSETATIVVDPCAGIEAGDVNALSVFPNPASTELNVVFENVSGTDATVVLTTTEGKVVYQTSAKAMSLFNEKINVRDFANGIYFINIKSETTSLVQRVVLN